MTQTTARAVGAGLVARLDGSKLTLEIDLSAPGSPSASGKSLVIASTRGNVTLDTPAGPVKVGLNVYRER